MFGKHKAEKLIYGIIGLGRFGLALATELAAEGAEMIILEKNEEKAAAIRELTENVFIVHNLEKKTLLETGLANCDVVVVCIGGQVDVSIMTVLTLSEMGIPKIIAKASSAQHGLVLQKLGAEVVYPEHDMAVRLAHRLETAKALDFIQLSEKINVTKLLVPTHAVGKTVVQVNLRGRYGINIIAVENGKTVNEAVRPDYEFCAGDVLYLSGGKSNIARLSEWVD